MTLTNLRRIETGRERKFVDGLDEAFGCYRSLTTLHPYRVNGSRYGSGYRRSMRKRGYWASVIKNNEFSPQKRSIYPWPL